jgi:RNA polymerase sigma-70 factor, ECF subfamily
VAERTGTAGESRGAAGVRVDDRIRAARDGSRAAMEDLLALYRGHLTVLAEAAIGPRLQSKVDASDVAQETLLKAHSGFPEFRGTTEAEWVVWLRRVLARVVVDHVRRFAGTEGRRVSRERSIEDALERSAAALREVLPGDLTSPSMAASKRESGAALADALAALEPEHRRVIVLRTLEEREWADVAANMERTPDAARMLWARALTRLRPLLEGKR